MRVYSELQPISASSTMYISNFGVFFQSIFYFYKDLNASKKKKNYRIYLNNPKNYSNEIELYCSNMQKILDSEKNYVNNHQVFPKVINCSIFLLHENLVQVQWNIKFKGIFSSGENIYTSFIDEAELEYPISSVYIFDTKFQVSTVSTSLKYRISESKNVIEYWGEKGDYLDNFERICFIKR
ncbi:MAG: hypothetical protein K9W44_06450 [Candidatus Lokiarchaeota archaeon]|nr:hypothetical protein [Candidatus Harpocratesius repetitus]